MCIRDSHGAAVLAAGGVVALLDLALEAMGDVANPDDARSALIALARASLEALEGGDAVSALTGPVARGEEEVVSRHLEALPPGPPRSITCSPFECSSSLAPAASRRRGSKRSSVASADPKDPTPPMATVVSLIAGDFDVLAARALRQADLADLVELRLDRIGHLSLIHI